MTAGARDPVQVIGGGLAGCEAAWQLARCGQPVVLHEMRPYRLTPAHRTGGLAELVCSNSFRSDDAEGSAVGLLHAELRKLGSLVMAVADLHRVPAGSALAVDRDGFSHGIEAALAAEPLITLSRGEVAAPDPGWADVIIATGPLTAEPLAQWLRAVTGADALAFFDAIAPIVHHDSIDFAVAWRQSRYDKGDGADYVNCPLDRDQYDAFVAGLLKAETVPFHDWERETPYFEGCLPIEVMASRGPRTLAFGPMKPVGLRNPHAGAGRPYAVVQLRQDNASGTLFNMVGFQTKLKHAEQVRLFRSIPGLGQAEFARLGGLHRNTFVNARRVLDTRLRLKALPAVRLAGQITGCEGYVESAGIGLLAGLFAAAERRSVTFDPPPPTTSLGALLRHLTLEADAATFQPMNVTFGLFPPLDGVAARKRGQERKQAYANRARADAGAWLDTALPALAAGAATLPQPAGDFAEAWTTQD